MAKTKGIRQVAWLDCAGGGQVVVERGYAYIGHMRNPHGTSIVDVRDPRHPKLVAELSMPPASHSHKVRVGNGLMVTNMESLTSRVVRGERLPEGWRGGIRIHDVSDPERPRHILDWHCTHVPDGGPASGVHRFDFDGRYAYLSPTMEGYAGNIMLVLDLADPQHPVEVSRWWVPGQWTAGGEVPSWEGWAHRVHHALRYGDRLNVSLWHGGFAILDVSDLAKPRFISGLDWSPPFPWPTHSAVKVPFPIAGRQMLLVSDEDVARLPDCPPYPAAFMWLVDVTDERHPVQFSSYQLEDMPAEAQPPMTGCHQPVERIVGPEVPVTWFAHGLRIIDISRPHAMREAAYFLPDPPPGSDRVQANDVYVDERGLIYLIDRVRGLHVLERV
jgi:hypothetical protein